MRAYYSVDQLLVQRSTQKKVHLVVHHPFPLKGEIYGNNDNDDDDDDDDNGNDYNDYDDDDHTDDDEDV